jgi:hypothetical protein
MVLTDHYFERSKLEELAQHVKQGQLPRIGDDIREPLLQQLRKSGLVDKLLRMQSTDALTEPRRFHYSLAYEILPVLAFTDPRISTGLAIKTHDLDILGDIWRDLQKEHDISGVEAPIGEMLTLAKHALLVVTMPRPLAGKEAYYVGIAYPRAWLEDQRALDSIKPKVRIFILAKSDGSEADSSATLFEQKAFDSSAIALIAPTIESFAAAVSAILEPTESSTKDEPSC